MVYRIRDRVEFDSATTEDTLYVDPVAGNDGYAGTIGAPLATIQEAVYRFIPPYAPPPNWTADEVKTVQVVYTPGMPPIQENLHKPLHMGDGVLVIQGEEDNVASVTQTGAAVPVSGYKSRHTVNFTTSPLGGTLGDGYFIKNTSDVIFGANNGLYAHYESFPIVGNTASSIDAVMSSPGSGEGFGFVDAGTLEIVRPQIIWRDPAISPELGPTVTQIKSDGGFVKIQGFIFERTNAGNNSRALICSPEEKTGFIPSTMFMRCHFVDVNYVGHKGHVGIYAAYIKSTASLEFSFEFKDYQVARCHFSTTSTVGLRGGNASLSSILFEKSGGTFVRVSSIAKFSNVFRADFRSGINLFIQGGSGSFFDLSFEGCTEPAIRVYGKAEVGIGDCIGSTGNTLYGLRLERSHSICRSSGGNTVTGSLGDVKVGGAPVATWGSLPVTDATTFNRVE